MPVPPVVIVPEGHGEAAKIAENWLQGGHLVRSKHHVVATQWQDEEICTERLTVDVECGVAERARRWYLVAARHGDSDVVAWNERWCEHQ